MLLSIDEVTLVIDSYLLNKSSPVPVFHPGKKDSENTEELN